MKILSWNVNGIRAAYRKGFLDWFKQSNGDIICLQEIRAKEDQMPKKLVNVEGYHSYFSLAEKKGYSGTAVYSREKPLKIEKETGFKRFDQEGRMIKLKFKDFTLINFYMPNGGRQKQDMDYKLKFYDFFLSYLKTTDENLILTGDFNIAHNPIDLARPESNKNNTGFTLEERERITKLIDMGFIDTFRELNKEKEAYTFWTYMHNAREKNIGWRIDYFFVSEDLFPKIKDSFILSNVKGSDHCPIGINLDI
jgi:exodeoxyribonuclease-3